MAAIARANSDLQVVNTVAETVVFSATVPAGALGTDRMVVATLLGEYLNNSGSAATAPLLRVKIGGVTIYESTCAAFTASDNPRAVYYEIALVNQGAANDQVGGGLAGHGNFGGTAAGFGDVSLNYTIETTGAALITIDAAVDTTVAQDLEITWEHGNASPNVSFTRRYAVADIVGFDAALPPEITSPLTASGQEGVAFQYFITADNAPTSFGATGLPAGLSVDTGTGEISGTPTVDGNFNVGISATNANGTDNETLVLTIDPAAGITPPTITSPLTAEGIINRVFTTYTITATESPTSFNAIDIPAGLTVDTGTGAIDGTPTESGVFNVTIEATNAGGTGNATLVLSIQPDLPAGLSIDTSTGLIDGTPLGPVGDYPIRVYATNAEGTGQQDVLLTLLTATPNPPVITSPLVATAAVGVDFLYTITATTPEDTSLLFDATNLPAGLDVLTTGEIFGTPEVDGTFQVTLIATNEGGSTQAILDLTITPAVAPEPPTITSPLTTSALVGQPFEYVITATNNPTSFTASGLPPGLTFNSTTGTISGTPVLAGQSNIIISAINATGSATVNLVLVVGQLSGPIPGGTPFLDLWGNCLDRELGSADRTQLFTEARRKQAINDAQKEFCRLTDCLTIQQRIPMQDGLASYKLDAALPGQVSGISGHARRLIHPIVIEKTPVTGQKSHLGPPQFARRSQEWLDRYQPGWRTVPPGVPIFYTVDVNGTTGPTQYVSVTPSPDIAAGDMWELVLRWSAEPEPMRDDADTPFRLDPSLGLNQPAPPELFFYHQALCHYAAYQLEKFRRNYQIAQAQLQLFQGYVADYLNRQQDETGEEHVSYIHDYLGDASRGSGGGAVIGVRTDRWFPE